MARRKKGKDNSSNVRLDAFLDILTCLVGVLTLIIVVVGLDASKIRVLIPTPMEKTTDKRTHFFECRNNQIYHIPLVELNDLADEKLKLLAAADTHQGLRDLVKKAGERPLKGEHYEVDLANMLTGHTVLTPRPDREGYPLLERYNDHFATLKDEWYWNKMREVNRGEEMVTFLVREDSIPVFKIARAIAWKNNLDVGYTLLASSERIRFGPLGEPVHPE